jgi:hypothetical protein
VDGFCENGNETLGSIKYLEILEYLSDCGVPRMTQLHGVS